ncbi:MAG: adenylosuccinate lyase [Candidatus Doudnabacteria bacterium RIFCSPLOWO2_02_FULL_49_13]|uniref:Adenylosuccinate lyase n=1 Tax=Candidatus Doudnabacteria bacterium RIFCSPHIGHO2_12_FULL_48_16 TaxID=1817838 RepID=A0A1F5PJL0_9BACT|nr:MAG: adenylosuccinate lyase [Candidatus Doudnabacteria bacterium RIFCSPHIGHO2_02_FULL_49_24]OGE89135.1 MAG: adenylosuccinate lyase [Candidatus Doudnabacteria bacterium RIFCSPHIGHO2_01_FULL_50_67]OGE90135.1 MAG: adenylosuccinate lyase [Candidatus Doudnabacteria bacterium RIFCSPHIGHO2_12_FULL_48_16]OGF03278.1 MAG: adenylosuccinate lyase [Candidatus Doudnabacteria bacterium RIFCSPLOWO2_02_FULL_49_13]OGF03824.1 MAG: adenylosuccinate lyase [Candidatus Doudnabacteria bacterium RIFCSPLOWO2_12_FULL_
MPLNSISPLDGRYEKYTKDLAPYFSESASMKYKVLMECEYLIALSETRGVGMRKLSAKEKKLLRNLYENFSIKDAQIISDIELKGYKEIKATNHDFKAMEYFIKEKLGKTSLKDILEFTHFGLTTWDATHTAYTLMIGESMREVYLPALEEIAKKIGKLAKDNKNIPMLARTHGQPASPTTFGKEFKIFEERLSRQIGQIKNHVLLAKLNGATGNYNALHAAYPRIDWVNFSKKFIKGIAQFRKVKMEINLFTTQIEPYDSFVELFDMLRRINFILIGFNQDVWRYISDDWIAQQSVAGEVGSSTMPHKINPWFLENSEGNLGTANALFEFFARKLPISRLQRDLSDSTVLRSIGTAFGHSLIGFKYLNNQLARIVVNKTKMREDLNKHPEVIAEAIQTILRREGKRMPYEKLKELTRGKTLVLKDIYKFIDQLDIKPKIKAELKKITPENYLGLAERLAQL